ncbi:MAG TPA: SH3 domain-containing protein [Gammaproteobacteria bacterium]|nr:SH3 domain-containing protein [Gammaproteobacteria bacterium]
MMIRAEAAYAAESEQQRPPQGAAKQHPEVVVEDPFLDLHSGPGRDYPVFYIAERGERVAVLKRRTDWFKVRVPRGEEGWVPAEQLERTLGADGKPFEVPGFELGDYTHRRWEVGALYGDFGGANLIAAYGAFSLTENITVEAWASQALGRFSDSKLLSLDVVETLYPEKRFSPYFTLGGGIVTTEPKATLVATTDRTDRAAHAGFGLRAYLTRRFVFRAEYKNYVIFTSRNDNEEIREWKAGFSFFL